MICSSSSRPDERTWTGWASGNHWGAKEQQHVTQFLRKAVSPVYSENLKQLQLSSRVLELLFKPQGCCCLPPAWQTPDEAVITHRFLLQSVWCGFFLDFLVITLRSWNPKNKLKYKHVTFTSWHAGGLWNLHTDNKNNQNPSSLLLSDLISWSHLSCNRWQPAASQHPLAGL